MKNLTLIWLLLILLSGVSLTATGCNTETEIPNKPSVKLGISPFITAVNAGEQTAFGSKGNYPPLLVTPHQRYMEREETKQFVVVSGVPPYTAVVIGEGYIEPVSNDDKHFRFTAGMVANQNVVIEFRDGVADKERVVKVSVNVEGPLRVVPLEMSYIPFGSKNSFKVTGGTGDYFAIADRGYAEIDSETGIGTYIAPDIAGNSSLTIVDSSDQEIVIQTVIGYKQPFISPSSVTLAPCEIKEFMVSYGAPKYDWGFEDGELQGMDSQNSVVKITAPSTAGIYTLFVKDDRQNEAIATIKVVMVINEEEVIMGIEKFFKNEELNGVKLGRQQLFLHLENFLTK